MAISKYQVHTLLTSYQDELRVASDHSRNFRQELNKRTTFNSFVTANDKKRILMKRLGVRAIMDFQEATVAPMKDK